MYSLILKDLLLIRKYLLFGLGYILLMIISFQNSSGPAMLTASTVALTYILIINVCAYDDKNKADLLLNSLPVSRAEIVLARYVSLLFFTGLAIIFYAIVARVITLLGLSIKVSPINGGAIVGVLLAVSFINSIYLPTYFKYGYIKSRVVNFVLFFGVFFGAGILAREVNRINSLLIKRIIEALRSQQSIVFLLVAMVLMLASYFLSLRNYRSRDF